MPSKKKKTLVCILLIALLALGIYFYKHNSNTTDGDGDEIQAAIPIQVQTSEVAALPKDESALGGYNVLIADRGNNRIIEVTPDKKIVWEYNFHLAKGGLGADDAFFTNDGKMIIVNLEELNVIELIDYATKKVTWAYGSETSFGSTPGFLHTPDDAYMLPNGDIIVADIKNCRIIEIAPDKSIVRQYGVSGKCSNKSGYLNKPNGDTPLPNGHILISNIVGQTLVELDENWKPVFTMKLPVLYPSDPQMTKAGNILVADYSRPGQIVEVDKNGNIVWQFDGDAKTKLNKPSLAIELPNGNILSNDDINHRVIVIDKKTKEIIWQYGVTGKPGRAYGQLNIPDGVDIIMRSPNGSYAPTITPTSTTKPNTIGSVSRHPANFVNKTVHISGYVLKKYATYAIFSDEVNGTIGYYDLPVSGSGIKNVQLKQKYILDGVLKDSGLTASNKNPYHLELTSPPTIF